jgi:hypothetical protein
VDALAQQVELLDAVHLHHDLPVQHHALLRHRRHLLGHVGEVAVHGLAAAALQVDLVAILEHQRPEAVPLGLVAPALALGELLRGLGQLGLDRRFERKAHTDTIRLTP